MHCQLGITIVMTDEQYAKYWTWYNGGDDHIQVALNFLTAGQREFLISRICDECFNKICPPDDEIALEYPEVDLAGSYLAPEDNWAERDYLVDEG